MKCSLDKNEDYIKSLMGLDYDILKLENDKIRHEERCDDFWIEKANKFKHIIKTIKHLEEIGKELRNDIITMADNKNIFGGGIIVTKCTRKGNIDYSSIELLKEVDLEYYRKPASEYWRIEEV